ncbi:MAG: response regulator transcription factor [Bacillota bacterium]|nr:response regulator transcription factor [Bacillota bacterium]
MIRMVIADDMVIFRESLKFIMEQDNEIKVVGCAGNGKEAAGLCQTLTPDLVLMDLMMPECDGVEGTKLIKTANPRIKVLVLTTFNDDQNVSAALRNGADGYVLKEIKPDELIMAVKSVSKGFKIIQQSAFNSVLDKLVSCEQEESNTASKIKADLTEKEKAIIRLIIDGKGNKEIGEILSFAEGSIKNTITGILNKFNLKDRTMLAIYAIKNNLV